MILVPAPSDHDQIASAVRRQFAAARAIRAESECLRRTRDVLLPLLMSGRVRVKDAEKVVDRVT
jgi:type I restriction enzyme S subunit